MACPVNTSDNEEMKLFLKSDKYIYRNFKTLNIFDLDRKNVHRFINITSLLTSLHKYVRLAINNNNSISDSNSNFGSYNAWVRGVSVSSCAEQKSCSLQPRRVIYHENVIMSTQHNHPFTISVPE